MFLLCLNKGYDDDDDIYSYGFPLLKQMFW